MLLLLFAGLGGDVDPPAIASGADGAGNGRRKRLYLGAKPGPAPKPTAAPAQPAPAAVEPYRPMLPGALQGLAPVPTFDSGAALALASAMLAAARAAEADDEHAAMIAVEMLMA